MITIPTRRVGFSKVDPPGKMSLEIFSDWLEASVLLIDSDLSKTDVLDVLMEEGMFDEQDEANAFISAGFLRDHPVRYISHAGNNPRNALSVIDSKMSPCSL